MRDRMLALVSRHCETLRQEAAEIDAAMFDLERDPEGTELNLMLRVHKLKGSSGSIGFAEISELCHEMQEILQASEGRRKSETELREIRSRHDKLRDRIASITPEGSTLYRRFS